MTRSPVQVTAGEKFGRGIGRRSGGHGSGRPGARLACACGKVYETRVSRHVSGITVSCGCFGREQNALALSRLRKLFVETGQRFGRGVVIDPEIEGSPQ